jgi:membrane protein insertase Oxa1/YidC/SpoIIIJ
LLYLLLFVFIYLGNYSASGTTGSGQKIVNKTAPVGMSVNFIIHILVLVFWLFFVCGINVYCIKHNALIILKLENYQKKTNNEKK